MKKVLSIIGILLAMMAGYVLNSLMAAESSGYLHYSWIKIDDHTFPAYHDVEEESFRTLLACSKFIPYWSTIIEDFDKYGGMTARCSTIKSWKINNK